MPPQTRARRQPVAASGRTIFRVSSAHEEGGERLYSVSTQRFSGDADGRVKALHAVKVELVQRGRPHCSSSRWPGSEFEIPADLVLLAMGFVGPGEGRAARRPRRDADRRAATSARDARWMTNVPGVFTAGDMQRGQSLIVWAIAEGRSAARGDRRAT